MSDTLEDAIEKEPFFISSQWQVGHVLTSSDIAVVNAMYDQWAHEVTDGGSAFNDGYKDGLRAVGGEDLVNSFDASDKARLERITKSAIARADITRKMHEAADTHNLGTALRILSDAANAAIKAGTDTTLYPDLNREKLRQIARLAAEMAESPMVT